MVKEIVKEKEIEYGKITEKNKHNYDPEVCRSCGSRNTKPVEDHRKCLDCGNTFAQIKT